MSARSLTLTQQTIDVSSIYGAKAQEPLVVLKIDDTLTQMSPEKALEVAHMLIEAAEASLQDGFMVEWFTETFELELPRAAQVLNEYRTWRNARLAARTDGKTHTSLVKGSTR